MFTFPTDEFGLPQGYPIREDWELTPRQVREMRRRGEPLVMLDCRTPDEAAIARIEPAPEAHGETHLLVPMDQLGRRLNDLEPHRDKRIVVYCHHGQRSLAVAAALRQQGFADVRSLAGGIDLWSRDIDPTVPRY